MTFTGKLRLALILAAIVPAFLIAVIVGASISEQIKRIEYRDARTALGHFKDLLDNAISRADEYIQNISAEREFQVMEMGYRLRGQVDPRYELPGMTLDFVEYIDSTGMVLLSHNRPALVGQKVVLPVTDKKNSRVSVMFRYENDIRGGHPSMAVIHPTEAGILIGGFFLDGAFEELLSAVMRADIVDLDLRSEPGSESPESSKEVLYRSQGQLRARLIDDPESEFQLEARFHQIERADLFSGFLTAVAAIMLFSLLVVISASLYFSAQTRKQIEALTGGAARVASGDFSRSIVEYAQGEFADVADSFNRMMRQLNDYRDRLIVTQKIAAWQTIGRKIAHEVKNPLTPISIAADDIRRSFEEKQPDFKNILENSTATIKKETERLKKLINEFSSFARMPAPEMEDIKLDTLLEDLKVLYHDEISNSRLIIESGITADAVRADPGQLRQLLINLIKNSLEAEADRILVSFSIIDKNLNVVIEDNGPGFPAQLLDDGITPYFSTRAGGTGLGLTICQRIVHDHDGSLKLENISQGGAGARVTVSLPQEHA